MGAGCGCVDPSWGQGVGSELSHRSRVWESGLDHGGRVWGCGLHHGQGVGV